MILHPYRLQIVLEIACYVTMSTTQAKHAVVYHKKKPRRPERGKGKQIMKIYQINASESTSFSATTE